jgi:ribA/ribD-fused uncharacterized protein
MDKLFYYSKSAHKRAGKGVNEFVSNYSDYDDLNIFTDWRKMLSNFYESEFIYEDKTYYTVEHAFQAKKIELVDKDKAYWFCKESMNDIGCNKNGLIARKNRKLVILNGGALAVWNEIKHNIMEEILLCKFTQNTMLQNVLLLTNNAILLHGTRGIPISRQYELENVRDIIRNHQIEEK